MIVGNSGRDRASNRVLSGRSGVRVRVCVAVKSSDSPQALINGAEIKVDLDFVVLKSNKRKSKTRVAAKPELKRNIICTFFKSIGFKGNIRGIFADHTFKAAVVSVIVV